MSDQGNKERQWQLCAMPAVRRRELAASVNSERVRAIFSLEDKWVNGTVLHYYFFNRESDRSRVWTGSGWEWRTWIGDENQQNVVREAFEAWKDVGIGLEFKEVHSRNDAEIRVGFMRGDGSWSYLGRQILNYGANARTMNFGWDLTGDLDTALHEIGHALGMPHEHQNPYAGIVWDEEAVYAALAAPPNNWDRDKTYYNIIRKISPDEVQGSSWDKNSIMHYPFRAGLIKVPEEYIDSPLVPEGALSDRDQEWARVFYPPLEDQPAELRPFESQRLSLGAGEQANFSIKPSVTRNYDFLTFGESDTVIVLFEDESGDLRYLTADDDSGEDYNAHLRVKLIAGREYVLRVRLYWSGDTGETAVMMW